LTTVVDCSIPAIPLGRGDRLPDAAHEPLAPTAGAPAPLDVAALSAAVSSGDAVAVEAFYRRYFDRLYAEARRATRRDEAFCLDVVQEAVLKIVRTIRTVQSEGQLLAWIRLVVRTAALDLLRAERRRQRREANAPRSPTDDGIDANLQRGEQVAWLREQIQRLDPAIVRLIELRYVERWTLSRIAERFRLSVGTVDGRLRRALAALRDAAREVDDV
jgi:RNA polymerase sigma factor (sigma-70 family)